MAVRPLASFLQLFRRFSKNWLFLLIRLFFILLQNLWWSVTGVRDRLKENRHPYNYERCAQVLRVLAWVKADYVVPVQMHDYICVHEGFIHPRYILDNDHVSLFFLDHKDEYAVFGEGNPGDLLWKSDFTPFMNNTMLNYSRKLIRIPFSALHRLAESVSRLKGRVVVASNVARCGSTLLTQMFECTDKCISISEPSALRDVSIMYKKEGNSKRVIQFTDSVIKVLCKPCKAIPDPAAYLLKPTSLAAYCMFPIRELYPDAYFFFMYRNLSDVSKSMYKMSFINPTLRLVYLACRLSGEKANQQLISAGFPPPPICLSAPDDFSIGVYLGLITLSVYAEMSTSFKGIIPIRFEDLIRDPLLAAQAIFKVSGVPVELASKGTMAFQRDSQRRSPISKAILNTVPDLEVSEEDFVRASQIMTQFGYSTLDQPLYLEGTLDFK